MSDQWWKHDFDSVGGGGGGKWMAKANRVFFGGGRGSEYKNAPVIKCTSHANLGAADGLQLCFQSLYTGPTTGRTSWLEGEILPPTHLHGDSTVNDMLIVSWSDLMHPAWICITLFPFPKEVDGEEHGVTWRMRKFYIKVRYTFIPYEFDILTSEFIYCTWTSWIQMCKWSAAIPYLLHVFKIIGWMSSVLFMPLFSMWQKERWVSLVLTENLV